MDTMTATATRSALWTFPVLAALACGGDDSAVEPRVPTSIRAVDGDGQTGNPGLPLSRPLVVEAADNHGNPAAGVTVTWSVVSGGGTISPTSSTTDAEGQASAEFTLGPDVGQQQAQAEAAGLSGSPVAFTETAASGSSVVRLSVAAGGNNVPERYSSDLWVHGNYAYTGTWGARDELGNVVNIWSLDAGGAPARAGSFTIPEVATVSDLQVSDDGQILVVSGEFGDEGGIFVYRLSNPAEPTRIGAASVGSRGVHTVTLSTISGRPYAFAAMNPGFSGNATEDKPALMIYDLSSPAHPTLVHREPIEPHYGIHDTFVRDGLAFVFAWDEGVMIFDVGNGRSGGSPASPVLVSRIVTAASDGNSPSVHNGWWFHNPVTSEQRYLFVGQEGATNLGVRASGDIHVVDVSDLVHPVEVAFFHLKGAGTHNFWMDEERQVLYAAYYNGGVIALDVSGTLQGDLSSRLLSQIKPGGAGNTFTWGVQLANGFLYAIDMLSGFWQLRTE